MKSENISQEELNARAKRTALLKKIPLIDDLGNKYSARVRNLSEKGMGGVCDILLVVGQKVSVELSGLGLIEGRVAWADESDFGIEFDNDINLKKLSKNHRNLASAATPYTVPPRYRPVESYKRPGFS